MRRPPFPLLLPGPTRLAQIGRVPARLILAAAALILVLVTGMADDVPDISPQIAFHAALVDGLRHGGGDYYGTAAATLRGHELPLTATAFPAPAGPLVAAMPEWIGMVTLAVLAGTIVWVWLDRARRVAGRISVVPLLALLGSVALGRTGMVAMPQLWAGLLVAVALGLRRPDRWVEPAALALAATMIAPAAVALPVAMLVLAWHDGLRREALGWAAALATGTAVIAIHLLAARGVVGFVAEPAPWSAAGPIMALQALVAATGLSALPTALGMACMTLAMAGWAVWRDPVAGRALATIVLTLLIAALSPADRLGAVLVAAPVACFGLIPAVEALRELIVAALDRRRITVTRVVR